MSTKKKPDHARQIDAITSKLPALDAAIAAAQQALDDALLTGSDTRPYRGQLRMARAARQKADHALAGVVQEQETESRERVITAARVIEGKAEAALKKLLARFEFTIEGLSA